MQNVSPYPGLSSATSPSILGWHLYSHDHLFVQACVQTGVHILCDKLTELKKNHNEYNSMQQNPRPSGHSRGSVVFCARRQEKKISHIRFSSHVPKWGSINFSTFDSMVMPLGVMILRVALVGIQGSCHMLIWEPVPTLQIHPLLKVWMPATILYHVKDDPFFGPALRIFPSG